MSTTLRTELPVDGRIVAERALATDREIASVLQRARSAQRDWRALPLDERRAILSRGVDAFVADGAAIAEELTWQMGRPLSQSPGEVRGFEERARHMIAIAPQALADIAPGPKQGFTRFIRREPLGVAFVLAPWNYPYLTAVNAVVPALLAGNAVILKPSHQTPLTGERMAAAFARGGLPDGVLQVLHLAHAAAERIMASDAVDFVAFTGSVAGGHAVQRALAGRFVGAGLELGGKDPAYVRPDADLDAAVDGLVDGAFFNAGQSCCGIERIYVHEAVYDRFVAAYAALTAKYVLGNPLEAGTTLGPMSRKALADIVRAQTAEAIAEGARALIDPAGFPADTGIPVSRAAGACRCDPWDAGHARGKLRSGRRHHAGGVGRRGCGADERQRIRADRGGLHAGRGGGGRARRAGRDRHLVHEPLRLSRPGACLDRSQEFRPRLYPVPGRLRAADTPQVLSPAARMTGDAG